MYKSSKQTLIFKYIFPFLFILGYTLAFIVSDFIEETPEGYPMAFAIMSLWISIFLVQMPFRLKNIETSDDGVKIIGRQNKLIPFSNIESVSKFDVASPWFMTIKYFDQQTQENKKICYMPSQSDSKMMADDAMTAFIKNKIKEENPHYSEENQPSTVKNFLFLMLLSSPVTLAVLYFISEPWF